MSVAIIENKEICRHLWLAGRHLQYGRLSEIDDKGENIVDSLSMGILPLPVAVLSTTTFLTRSSCPMPSTWTRQRPIANARL